MLGVLTRWFEFNVLGRHGASEWEEDFFDKHF